MPNILIYTVASKAHGFGHLQRMLVLAGALQARGCGVLFCTEHETPGLDRLRQAGANVYDFSPADWSWAYRFPGHDCCIIDLESGPSREMLQHVRMYFKTVVVVGGTGYGLSDPGSAQELADLQIYQGELFEYPAGATDTALNGPDYLIVQPEYAGINGAFEGPIIVSMGGGDPHGLAALAVNALAGVGREIVVINGPAADDLEEREGIHVVHAPASLLPHLDGAALLIGALGMTAYEAAAAGVPSILTAWSDKHIETARELDKRGVAVCAGLWDEFVGFPLAERVNALLSDFAGWHAMHDAGKALVDGQGAARVAERIEQRIGRTEHPALLGVERIAVERVVDSGPAMAKPRRKKAKEN